MNITRPLTRPLTRQLTRTLSGGVSGVSNAATFPAFEKLGVKLTTPSWLVSTGQPGPYFPRIFENDLYRSALPGLPASRFSLLYSSDHAVGAGYIGRVDFDSIEDAWTDFGDYVHTASNQREAPHAVYDAANNRVNVYIHDATSTLPYGVQSARLITTTDLETFAYVGEVFDQGAHTGYGQFFFDGSKWRASSFLSDGEAALTGRWEGNDPDALSLVDFCPNGFANIVPSARSSFPYYFQWRGKWWGIGVESERPRTGSNGVAITATELSGFGGLPVAPSFVLLEPGGVDDGDRYFGIWLNIKEIDGSLYIVYLGKNTALEQSFFLAKSTAAVAVQRQFYLPTGSDGLLSFSTTQESVDTWDAANDALPAGYSITAISGTDASSQSAGNYYEIKTGSGSSQQLLLAGNDFAPWDHKTVELEFRNITFSPNTDDNTFALKMGFADNPASPANGVDVLWNSSNVTGTCQAFDYGKTTTTTTYALDFFLGSNSGRFNRQLNYDSIKLRLDDYGARITILINDFPTFTRDISAEVNWSESAAPYLYLESVSPFEEVFCRFSEMSLAVYESDSTSPQYLEPRVELDAGVDGLVLNSTDPDTQATNGQSVVEWIDQKEFANATQSTEGSKPVFVAGFEGDLGVLDFDGTADHLSANDAAVIGLGNDRPLTVIVVVAPDAFGSDRTIVSWGATANANNFLSLGLTSTGTIRVARRGVNTTPLPVALSTETVPTGELSVISYVFFGTTVSAWINGVKVIDAAGLDTAETIGVNVCTIGALRRSTISNYYDGKLAGVVIYDYPLPDAIREAKEAELAARWGITF